MKILSLLNVSSGSEFACDSGFILQCLLSRELKKRGIRLILAGPDVESFRAVPFPHGQKRFVPLGMTKYHVRYHFDWPVIANLIEQVGPDAILNNQVELSAGIRAVLVTLGLHRIPLISYCHYLPIIGCDLGSGKPLPDPSLNASGMSQAILLNLLASCGVSDVVLVQSAYAAELLTTAARYHGIDLAGRIRILPPPFDQRLRSRERRAPPATRRILYNHRLYDHYGFADVLAVVDGVAKQTKIEFVVPEVLVLRSSERHRLDPSVTGFRERLMMLPYARLAPGGADRRSYRLILNESRVGIAPFRPSCVWSMATIDCMGIGMPVVAPRYGAYPEFVPAPLLCDSHQHAMSLLRRLLTDDDFWVSVSNLCREATTCFPPAQFAEGVLTAIMGTAGNRVDGREPCRRDAGTSVV